MTHDTQSPEAGIGSVLILEDEGLVSLLLEDIARELGAQRIDVFADVTEAHQAALNGDYDCAVLDVFIRDGTSVQVADALEARGIPFIFSTGVGAYAVGDRHRDRPVVTKPFADETLKSALLAVYRTGQRFAERFSTLSAATA